MNWLQYVIGLNSEKINGLSHIWLSLKFNISNFDSAHGTYSFKYVV